MDRVCLRRTTGKYRAVMRADDRSGTAPWHRQTVGTMLRSDQERDFSRDRWFSPVTPPYSLFRVERHSLSQSRFRVTCDAISTSVDRDFFGLVPNYQRATVPKESKTRISRMTLHFVYNTASFDRRNQGFSHHRDTEVRRIQWVNAERTPFGSISTGF